jgi:putative peptidoglycan lipid II flippase
MLSRLLGFARDVVMARQLGLGSVADAFFIAWLLPNLFRRLFGEGALSAAFVPVFVESREKGDPEEAARLSSAAVNRLALGLTALVLALELVSWGARIEIGHALAGEPGLGIASRFSRPALEHAALVLELSQVLLPYLVFICISGLLTGALNSLDHFAAPAAAPCVLNAIWIAALVVGGRAITDPVVRVQALAWALVLGGAIQLAMHVVAMHKLGLPLKPVLRADPEKLARVRRLFYSVAFGLAVFQVNALVDSLIAETFIPEGGGVATLFYANRIVQLPIGTVGIAVATAIFPELTRLLARGDRRGFERTADEALGASLFIALPCTVGLAVLAHPIVRVLFERGQFGPEATERTARVVLAFAGAVAAGCTVPTLTRAFYAEQDTRTPVRTSVWAVFANFALNLVLVGPLREAGLALATTLSQLGQLVVLYAIHARRRKLAGGESGLAPLGRALARTAILCVVLAAAAEGTHAGLAQAFGDELARHGSLRALALAAAIGAGGGAYLGVAWLWSVPELPALVGVRARKRKATPAPVLASAPAG